MTDWAIYKPLLTALALPPVPFILLTLVGARLILPRRGLGYLFVLLGLTGLWFSSTQVTAVWLQQFVLKPPEALRGEALERLEQAGRGANNGRKSTRAGAVAGAAPQAAIIVLGAGREPISYEYGVSDLTAPAAQRLRYGVWLSRRTGLPLGASGGIGWAQVGGNPGPAEAEVAARIADQVYGVPMKWVEPHSSDTRGNAALTVTMLAQQGVAEVVVVTEAYHMRRAHRAFVEAVQTAAVAHPEWPVIKVTDAPMGFWRRTERPGLDWLPSAEGMARVHLALKEWLGWVVGS